MYDNIFESIRATRSLVLLDDNKFPLDDSTPTIGIMNRNLAILAKPGSTILNIQTGTFE